MMARFLTISNVAVYAVDEPYRAVNGRGWRLPCARVDTRNFHGNLNVAHLRATNQAARAMVRGLRK